MEETKWLTKGKIIIMVAIVLVIGSVVAFILVHRSNLKKDYIKFQNQLEYAAPNYILKEKITLMENEWREIDIKEIMKQKLVINKRSTDCEGYVIAEAHENVDEEIPEEKDELTAEGKNTSLESDNKDDKNASLESDAKDDKNTSLKDDTKDEESTKKVSNNISYKAYISCKKIYKTPNYGTKPNNKNKNDEETQSENDTERPVIELFGDKEIKLTEGDKYEEPGAIATDNIDGDITSKIKITGKVNTSKPGKYVLKYIVSDSSKNKTTKSRTVIVEAKKVEEKPEENETPETPSTQTPETPTEPQQPTEPQKPVEPQQPVEPQKPVRDTISPVIVFNDNSLYQTICTGNKVNISTNGAYGYIARDNVDGNITGRVKITGDTGIISKPGVYNLHYEVSDNAGNMANATKQFTVKSCSSTIPSTDVKIPVNSIVATPSRKNLSVNQRVKINVTIYPSNANDKSLTFSSLNSSIATVSSDGTITAVSAGSTRIKVSSSNGKVAYVYVTVTN